MITKLIEYYDKLKAKVLWFIKDWSEFWAVIPALILFLYFPQILRMIDPTAGGYDVGYLGKFVLTLVFLLLISAFVWVGIRYNFPTLFKYGDSLFNEDWKTLTPWQRMLVYFSVSSFYILVSVLLVITL